MSTKVATRTIVFVLIYFVGWFPAVVACIYALIYAIACTNTMFSCFTQLMKQKYN